MKKYEKMKDGDWKEEERKETERNERENQFQTATQRSSVDR